MERTTDFEKEKNEVLRKIGRNMLLFQKMEYMLKFLIANGSFSGYASEISKQQVKRAGIVKKQTLGALIGQYIENTHSVQEEVTDEPENLKEAFFSFNFKLDVDAVYYEEKKEALGSLVADRNELVHHLLPRLNDESKECWLETGHYLDRQREKLIPELEQLRSVVGTLEKGKKELGEFFQSDEFKKQFELSWLRQSRLVLLLGDIATQIARQDGWTPLSVAGQLVKQHAPEEMVVLKRKYGKKGLKDLILATDLFDLTAEQTDGGGTLILYRLKSEWTLQIA